MDDLISRRELLESIEKVSVKGNVLDDDWVYRFVQEFPSIDAVKHGRWIPVDWAEPRRYGCSECHRMVWELENFCPSCGARMDEREES